MDRRFIVLLVSGCAVELLLRHVPARFINVRRRDYWLAPERAGYTRAIIGELILWLGLVMFGTVSALNHIIMQADLNPTPTLGPWPWVIVGMNLLATGSFIGFFVRRFFCPA